MSKRSARSAIGSRSPDDRPLAQATVWPEPGEPRLATKHVPALDGLRGLAILLVLFHHQTFMQEATAFDRIFVRVADFCWTGVDLFFVLSGFLITGILLDSRRGDHYFRNFYARRTLRIFPLYYAVLFFALWILPLLASREWIMPGELRVGEEKWYWLYLSNFLIAERGFRHIMLDVSWSLAIEEQFYVMWAVIVWLLRPRTLAWVCVAVIVGSALLRSILVHNGVEATAVYVWTFTRMDVLAVGALLALTLRRWGELRLRAAARLAGPFLVVAILAMWSTGDNQHFQGRIVQSLGYTAIAALFGTLLILAVAAGGVTSRLFSVSILRTFGKYSYAIYLFHAPWNKLMRDTFTLESVPTLFGSQIGGQLLFYVAASAPVLLAGWVSWHVFEKHMLKLKRFFPYEAGR